MADIRRLSATYAVAPQLEIEDLPTLAAAGFRTVIANRPDGEASGQPSMDEVEAAATAAGLAFTRIPIAGPPALGAVEATAAAMAAAPGPILAYCRSGTRSATLWALASALRGDLSTEAILKAAREAGYDLGGQATALDRLRQ
jgi:uncharacterized protein (TIGR01244 family)